MKLSTGTIIAIVLAAGSGLIEMRVAVGRLEERLLDIDRRVGRIEQACDTRSFATLEHQ